MSTSTTPSLAQLVAEVRDAWTAFEDAMGQHWSHYTPEEVGAAAVRYWYAKRDLNAAITEPAVAS